MSQWGLNSSVCVADYLEMNTLMFAPFEPRVHAFALSLAHDSVCIYRQDSDVCLIGGFQSSYISWVERLCVSRLGPPLGSVKGGDVTCNCAHPSPRNRATRRSRGLWRLARFQAAAHQVCELNGSSAAQSVTFFFARPWAVSERAHRPRPCSDNTPPLIFPHVQSQERHVLVRGTLCWWNLFFFVFLARDGRKFSGLDWIWKWEFFFFFFLPFPPMRSCGMALATVSGLPGYDGTGASRVLSPQWDECVWVEVKSLAAAAWNWAPAGSQWDGGQGRVSFSRALIRPIAPATTLHSHW